MHRAARPVVPERLLGVHAVVARLERGAAERRHRAARTTAARAARRRRHCGPPGGGAGIGGGAPPPCCCPLLLSCRISSWMLRIVHVDVRRPRLRPGRLRPCPAWRLRRQRRRIERAQAVLDDELEVRERVRLARARVDALLDVLQQLDGLGLVALGLEHARLVVLAELLEALHVDLLELLERRERVVEVLVLVRGVGLARGARRRSRCPRSPARAPRRRPGPSGESFTSSYAAIAPFASPASSSSPASARRARIAAPVPGVLRLDLAVLGERGVAARRRPS